MSGEGLYKLTNKWLERWEKLKIFEADADPGKPKFFLTAAFPYPNSPPHIGHARTYTITDVYARYMRMKGYNVLLPMGFHYTGTPIVTMAEFVKKGDKELIDIFVNVYRVPKEDIDKLKTPLGMANYFSKLFKEALRKLGISVDWRRTFRSIDPEFQSFVVWQYLRLREKGYIIRGTHPVGWCPVHNIPVGMHDTKGDIEPEIGEFTVILFKLKGEKNVYIAAATLRPETILGVTNIWVRPDVDYEIVNLSDLGIKIVLSERASFKLRFQRKDLKTTKKIKGEELIGKRVLNPVTDKEIPILPASFVNPNFATGVVMSVPAHAPYDYIAIKDIISNTNFLKSYNVNYKELTPIPLIIVRNYSEIPAADEIQRLNIVSQNERNKLDKATQNIYSIEYKYGKIRRDVISFSNDNYRKVVEKVLGMDIPKARDIIKEELLKRRNAITMYEIMNGPVYCRCGTEIVVKILRNQWFLDYGNRKWKFLAKKALSDMRIIPAEMRSAFERTIDWLEHRAMARTRGLGTPLPWDKSWVIESLSDSTVYMAFYTVSHLIRKYKISREKLVPEVWNYILLGEGDIDKLSIKLEIPKDFLVEARREFMYWYPLDSRHSGKDLVENHLTFMIFHHVALFPKKLWPKQIVTNGFVLYEGKKMSKSLRNIVPLTKAIEEYGPDSVRATLIYGAQLGQDLDFSPSLARRLERELENLIELAIRLKDVKPLDYVPENRMNRWLLSVLKKTIKDITKDMDSLKFRAALHKILFVIRGYVDWWIRRKNLSNIFDIAENGDEESRRTLRLLMEAVIKMLQPFTPFTAEEIWELFGYNEFISKASWPDIRFMPRDPLTELEEEYLKFLISDINEIKKVLGKKIERIKIIVAQPEDYDMIKLAVEVIENGKISELYQRSTRRYGKRKGQKIGQSLFKFVTILSPELRELVKEVDTFDEVRLIEDNIDFVKEKTDIKDIEISIYEGEMETKGKLPLPLRPAIIAE